MKNLVLPLGTIILKENEKKMIVGYTQQESGENLIPLYLTVPYPKGYIGKRSLQAIEMTNIEVVQKGFFIDEMQGCLSAIYDIQKTVSLLSKKEWEKILKK